MPIDQDDLSELDYDVGELKKNYELYFQGINKIPPERDFVKVQSTMRRYRAEWTTNTAIKFRLSALVSKFQAFSRYWNRVMKEIEEGRYHRDLFKADMRVGKVTSPTSVKAKSITEDDERISDLHKKFMMARLECSQGVEGMTMEKLKASIEKSLPQLQKKYPGKKIEYKVVIEKGKAKLKAIPK